MEVCFGWSKTPIRLTSTRKYCPEEILARCKRHSGPFWIRVEGEYVPMHEQYLPFACCVSASYHNQLAYNAVYDDGFCADMAERERRIQAHMDEPCSDDSGSES